MKLVALALVLAGCYRPGETAACATTCPCPASLECGPDNVCRTPGTAACTATDAPLADASADGAIDSSSDAACFGHALGVHACVTSSSSRTFPAERGIINTDSNCDLRAAQQNGGDPLCFVIGGSITIDGTVHVTGAAPLVLLATDTITVAATGRISAGSPRGGTVGANADFACTAINLDGLPAATTAQGGGGGAGGSFHGTAGAGGGGDATNGGAPTTDLNPLTFVRGGCAGGHGGDDATTTGSGGAGGHSGGAIYFLAGTSITVDGAAIVDASGEGGGAAGTGTFAGAGGGGSGGLLVFDAPTVTLNGLILASGGGGGGGGDGTSVTAPQPGNDPTSTLPTSGGAASGNGGSGGAGSSRASDSGNTASSGGSAGTGRGCGGGGGGASAGHIIIVPMQSEPSNIAPMPE